jgi:hypothetical protein
LPLPCLLSCPTAAVLHACRASCCSLRLPRVVAACR